MLLTTDPKTETYFDVQKLIWKVCDEFQGRHGGEFEELESEANIAYLQAYNSWQPDKAPFPNYVAICIWRRLLGVKRCWKRQEQVWRTLPHSSEDERLLQVEDTHREFDRTWIEDLSDDAKTVLHLVFETPSEIASAVEAKGGEARNLRSTIKAYLQDIGWATGRIVESFDEIREEMSQL